MIGAYFECVGTAFGASPSLIRPPFFCWKKKKKHNYIIKHAKIYNFTLHRIVDRRDYGGIATLE